VQLTYGTRYRNGVWIIEKSTFQAIVPFLCAFLGGKLFFDTLLNDEMGDILDISTRVISLWGIGVVHNIDMCAESPEIISVT